MKLWIISQDENTGYDTYDAVVVAAETEEDARCIHPLPDADHTWVTSVSNVQVREIGIAKDGTTAGVILASFNAG